MTEENQQVGPADRHLFQQGPDGDLPGPEDPDNDPELLQEGSSDMGTGADPVNPGRPDQGV